MPTTSGATGAGVGRAMAHAVAVDRGAQVELDVVALLGRPVPVAMNNLPRAGVRLGQPLPLHGLEVTVGQEGGDQDAACRRMGASALELNIAPALKLAGGGCFARTPAGVAGVASLFTLAQIPPARDFLLGRMESGEGPSAAEREKGWFKVTFVGKAGGQKVMTEVSGGDPGYGETSKMLAESAMCLAIDDNPKTAGAVNVRSNMERRNRGSRSSSPRRPLPVAYHHSNVEASPVTVTKNR